MPVVGVIEPGVRALVAATRNGRVGVIGTVGTIGSGAYQRAVAGDRGAASSSRARRARGSSSSSSGARPTSDQVHVLAERLLAPVRDAGVDTLLLGCTHYPYLARTISDVMGRDVVLVSSADETAFEVRAVLDADAARTRLGGCEPGDAPLPVVGRRRWFAELGRTAARPRARSRRGAVMGLT